MLVNDGGSQLGHRCPNCGLAVQNVATSAVFGAYKTMPNKGAGSRSTPPLANWLFYGAAGERYLFKNEAGEPCIGDWGRHYQMKINQVSEGGWKTQPFVSFLWLQGVATGQGRMGL